MRRSDPPFERLINTGALLGFALGYAVPLRILGAAMGLLWPFRRKPDRMEVLTFSYSHYSEKVLWALDRGGDDYVERVLTPTAHYPRTLYHSRGLGTTVPLLLDRNGKTVQDSSKILGYLHQTNPERYDWLYPTAEVLELEKFFNNKLGVGTAFFTYHHLYFDPTLEEAWAESVAKKLDPDGQRIWPFFRTGMKRVMKGVLVLDEKRAVKGLTMIEQAFSRADAQLEKHPYLAGDRMTAADIAFGAFGSWVVFPDQRADRFLPFSDKLFKGDLARTVERLRKTKAGKHVLALYEKERPRR